MSFLVLGGALMLALPTLASAVPGNEADPPMPPSDFGNLFDDGSPRVYDCRVDQLRSDATQSTVVFRSNLPHNRARYWQTGATWSNWTSLSANEYVCNSPACLWLAGSVEIRGCLDAAGTNCPGLCTVNVGSGAGGMPVVAPTGFPMAAVNHAGCAESDHTTLRFQARWTGAASSGYPRTVDAASTPIALTFVSSVINAGEFTGTYTIPAGWAAGFTGTWPFTFSIGPSRAVAVDVEVREHCLEAPEVYQVATDATRTRVYAGQTVLVSSASEMVVETGNSGVTLVNHQLDPSTETLGTVFTPPVPTPGATQAAAWSEAGEWDTVVYSSPETDITLEGTGTPCAPAGTHKFWLDPSSSTVNLAAGTAWESAPTIRTDGCAGVTPGTPSGANEVVVVVGAGSVTAGWPVQVRATTDRGAVADRIDFSAQPGWVAMDLNTFFDVQRTAACLPGERLVGMTCQACPNYQACDASGSLVARQHCAPGTAPADARIVSYQVCNAGTTVDELACVGEGGLAVDPVSAPCSSCSAGQRLVGLNCQVCPDYQACDASGNLVTQQWCAAGTPVDSYTNTYEACNSGVTENRNECVGAGDTPTADAPCPAQPSCAGGLTATWTSGAWVCPPCVDPVTERWWLDSSADVGLPGSTDWVAGPTIRTNVCSGTPASSSSGYGESEVRIGAGSVATGWPVEVRARDGFSRVYDLHYWLANGFDYPGTYGDAWYFYARRDEVSCPTGQRRVGGVCEPCATYQACSSGTLVQRDWCDPGVMPNDSTVESYQICSGTATATVQVCVDDGDLPPASAQMVNYQACQSGATVTLQACVAAGGSPPGNTPCITTCGANERLVSGVCRPCPTYSVCAGSSSLSTRYWCQAGSPPTDAEMVDIQACRNPYTTSESPITVSRCSDGGIYNPVDSPCSDSADPDCPRGRRMDGGRCRDCPSVRVCEVGNPGSLINVDWCWQGTPPADVAWDACGEDPDYCPPTTMPACPEGTGYSWNSSSCMWSEGTRNPPSCTSTSGVSYWDDAGCRYRCGTDPGNRPVDPPDPPTQGIETYCDSSGNARTRPASGSSNVNNLDTVSDCTSGETLNSDSCCVPDSVTPTYQACSNGVVTPEPWTGSGNPVDDPTATRTYCVGPTRQTETICGSSDDDDRPSRCSSGYSFNTSGCCAQDSATQTYEACSNGVVTTEDWTGSGNPVDDPTATRTYCVGSSMRTETICASSDRDDRPNSCSSGYILNSDGCCQQTDPVRGTETYCDSNGNAQTRPASGTVDVDSRPASCSSGEEFNSDRCCVTCSATEMYCRSGSSRSRPISGCSDRDIRSATETYCSGSAVVTRSISSTCTDVENLDSRCPTGSSLNAAGCCEADACVQPSAPACTGIREGEDPRWNATACRYDWYTVTTPSCVGTLVWEDTTCSWDCEDVDITFSFPALISEQTSAATYEQNLDLTFDSDGSITLTETLVGPGISGADGTTITNLGNWATGADVDQASSVVEYRLAITDWGTCMGSSGWSAFSSLGVGVFGEAHVGQSASSCTYEFRNSDTRVSLGSSRIQLSTQASSGPGLPGGITQ